MPVRIHFTAEDLARTRTAGSPRPFVELHIALRALQEARQPARFTPWRRYARSHLPPRARQLLDLVPARGWSTDFFIPVCTADARKALEAVRATSRTYLRQDLEEWGRKQVTVPRWTRRLADEPALFQELVDVLGETHDRVIAPFWPQVERIARADRALRLRHLADGGVERLLTRLDPRRLRWLPPVLEVHTAGGDDRDVRLGGRGLLLVPSLFRHAHPMLNDGARPQPWLSYPLRDEERLPLLPGPPTPAARTAFPPSLAALLGRTRAAVLCAIADHPGCTTTELARHAGIAPASASEHATVLRAAGLTSVTRHVNTALHTLSPAGETLLNAPTAG